MKTINGIKVGNVVNLSINGKLHKKNCGSPKEADELFKAVLKAKEFPTDENVRAIKVLLNEKLRVALLAGLETDIDNGEVFLAGFNTPLPLTLVDIIKEYHENNYPIEPIINFWKLLMINPDKRIRTVLFDFISKHDFVLTDMGYMIVYKAVNIKPKVVQVVPEEQPQTFISDLDTYIIKMYFHVKKVWKEKANKYSVYATNENTFGVVKTKNIGKTAPDNIFVIGELGNLYDLIENKEIRPIIYPPVEVDNTIIYTDMHTNQMNIVLGEPVRMDRKNCDSDPLVDCSYGLHVGATSYVNGYARNAGAVLACFINPANVVAVPTSDTSKMRVTEYFPFAVATYENGKIDIIEQKYFENDYCNFEISEIEAMIEKVKSEEFPMEKAINAEPEIRPMSELLKILELRVVDIT